MPNQQAPKETERERLLRLPELLLSYAKTAEYNIWIDCDLAPTLLRASKALSSLLQEVEERRHADAEFAGTNSCVDDERRALLYLKHRNIARQLQEKWIGGPTAKLHGNS
jgi:hypothetical protein